MKDPTIRPAIGGRATQAFAEPQVYVAESPGREAWRMFARNRTAVFGLVLLIVILAVRPAGLFGKNLTEKV